MVDFYYVWKKSTHYAMWKEYGKPVSRRGGAMAGATAAAAATTAAAGGSGLSTSASEKERQWFQVHEKMQKMNKIIAKPSK